MYLLKFAVSGDSDDPIVTPTEDGFRVEKWVDVRGCSEDLRTLMDCAYGNSEIQATFHRGEETCSIRGVARRVVATQGDTVTDVIYGTITRSTLDPGSVIENQFCIPCGIPAEAAAKFVLTLATYSEGLKVFNPDYSGFVANES